MVSHQSRRYYALLPQQQSCRPFQGRDRCNGSCSPLSSQGLFSFRGHEELPHPIQAQPLCSCVLGGRIGHTPTLSTQSSAVSINSVKSLYSHPLLAQHSPSFGILHNKQVLWKAYSRQV